jgi:hypothetical protein
MSTHSSRYLDGFQPTSDHDSCDPVINRKPSAEAGWESDLRIRLVRG